MTREWIATHSDGTTCRIATTTADCPRQHEYEATGERECRTVKPGTLGYQQCWLPLGHAGAHRAQGFPIEPEWCAGTDEISKGATDA